MTTPPIVELRPLAAAVKTQLDTVAHATGYVTEAMAVPQIPGSDKAKPYWVFHPGAGDPTVEPDLADTAVELDWTFQVTCAAGLQDDLLALVDRVNTALYRWIPVVEGFVCGPLKPPRGFSVSVLLDRSVMPHRPYLALQFTTTVTTA